mgnify:CR=1 FL=1
MTAMTTDTESKPTYIGLWTKTDKNGKPFYKIDRNDFTLFTKNEEENKKVDAIHKFIDAVEELEKHVHIYKGGITPLTSNLLRYDLRLMDWEINQEYFR